MTALHTLSATETARAIAAGRITSVQLVADCIERIRARDGLIEAWIHFDPEVALAKARAADEWQRRGAPLGSLHGVPIGIKDIIDTCDWPTENGSIIFKDRRPRVDAAVVQRLQAAGAVIMGKTVTTELAFYTPGRTRNPHDTERTPGGSSSGSAAAVADYQVPLALGTQTAGSILRPASYCGVYGFKPTYGAVPTVGVLAQSEPLDTIGGYARSSEDMALLMLVMAEPGLFNLSPEPSRSAKKFAFIKTTAWDQGEASMKVAFAEWIEKLGPARVEELTLPPAFDVLPSLQRAVQFHDIANSYGPLLDAHADKISAKMAEVIGIGRGVSEADYQAARALKEPLYQALAPILDQYEAIVTPAATGPALKGLAVTGSPTFNFLWTFLGMPALSVPLLKAEGLPLGVQLVGKRGSDAGLLKSSEQFTQV
jgi:Asp-tRNA(Asn)/Glu-tRNA(Gln) amidotransferase A subunit family amidase